jgi:3-hydroxyisobutyrate dehydrogenase-like beta-hydroxyacid dehydrogenase
MQRVGVIGFGKMGRPIARHLMNGGFKVCAYDLDASRKNEMTALGVQVCDSPRDVAANSELVIAAVGFDNEVLDVVNGADGLLAGVNKPTVIAIVSTVSVDTMHAVEQAATRVAAGVDVLDIPLCRGEPAAEAGSLLLLAGGKRDVFDRCRPAFETFASDCHFLGALGAGQTGKMINNLLLWACVSANHEGLKLGAAMGVDPEVLRKALLQSSGNNWALETWLQPRPMPWAEKDMAIVMQEADNARLSLPLCGVVREVVKGMKIEKGLIAPRPVKTR